MDKNFVWRNSETINASQDGVFSLAYPTEDLKISPESHTFNGKLTKANNTCMMAYL
jgi:hypothetical protein